MTGTPSGQPTSAQQAADAAERAGWVHGRFGTDRTARIWSDSIVKACKARTRCNQIER